METCWDQDELSLKLSGLPMKLRTKYARRAFEEIAQDIRNGEIALVARRRGKKWRQLAAEIYPFSKLGDYVSSNDALVAADLAGARLRCMTVSNMDLGRAILDNADCVFSIFFKVMAIESKFREAKCMWSLWNDTKLTRANLKYADFSGADLKGIDFSGCDLTNANFRAARVNETNFKGAILVGCDFSGAHVSESEFKEADFDDVSFCFAVLNNCRFLPDDVKLANFYGARVDGSRVHNFPSRAPVRDEEKFVATLARMVKDRKRLRFVRKSNLLFRLSLKLGFLRPNWSCDFDRGKLRPARVRARK